MVDYVWDYEQDFAFERMKENKMHARTKPQSKKTKTFNRVVCPAGI
jgi:hypothetical protein